MKKNNSDKCWEEIEAILKKYKADLIHQRGSSCIISIVSADQTISNRVFPSLLLDKITKIYGTDGM